jgi:hypothetical protein
MSGWNYVVTAHKPTNVTHSCVGNFTNPQELNLIIAYPTHTTTTIGVFCFGFLYGYALSFFSSLKLPGFLAGSFVLCHI